MKSKKMNLTPEAAQELISILQSRFEKNKDRHKAISWAKVAARLEAEPGKLWSLNEMEMTGGEPDVISYNKKTDEYLFVDCAPESPKGRRSVCFDHEALESRKEHKPRHSAMAMAAEMGANLLTEAQYRELQELGAFDLKTSSWVQTPGHIRALGGALFCDRRYDTVFTYHNGAESYYAARGFRVALTL